jgi:hypothetical protein
MGWQDQTRQRPVRWRGGAARRAHEAGYTSHIKAPPYKNYRNFFFLQLRLLARIGDRFALYTTVKMSFLKRQRGADADANGDSPLKSGGRPVDQTAVDDGEAFEDEYEDEFESEDEIMEAGVDGRPDAEREAEEGKFTSAFCKVVQ